MPRHADTHGQAVEVSCQWSQGHQVNPCGLQDEESLSEGAGSQSAVNPASSENIRASNSAYRCSHLVWMQWNAETLRVNLNPLQQTLQFISISYATVPSVGEKWPKKENRRCWNDEVMFWRI